MASHAEIKAALRATKGDVSAAFENVQAAGRATEALKDDFAKIERLRAELRQAEINYAEQAKALAKRKAEKEEARRIALQLADDLSRMQADSADATIPDADDIETIDLTTVDDSNVVWGQPNPDFRLSPGTMEDVLYFVKRSLGVQETGDRSFFRPFWFTSNNISAEDLYSIKVSRDWVRFEGGEKSTSSLQGPFFLQSIDYDKDKLVFQVQGYTRTLSAPFEFKHGVLVTKRTSHLPPLIAKVAVKRYEFASKLDKAFLQAVISIIPGTFGYEKRGKGQITKAGIFKIANVRGYSAFFRFSFGDDGTPVLLYSFSASPDRHDSEVAYHPDGAPGGSVLTRATYDNAMKLLRAWEELDKSYNPLRSTLNRVSMDIWRKERKFSPHVTVMDTLEEDTSYYVDRAAAENDKAEEERRYRVALDRAAEQRLQQRIAKEGIQNGSLMMRIDFFDNDRGGGSRYHDFYRVVPEGEITDGKGNLRVQYFDEERTEGIRGLPSMADLKPEIISKRGLKIVPPGKTEFLNETWIGD